MTKAFDSSAREFLQNNLCEFNMEYENQPVSFMEIREVSVKYARPFIATYHYSKTMPDSTKNVYAGYFGNALAGIVVFGMGCNKQQFTSLMPDLCNGEYRELTRLWSPDCMPRNTESKLIGGALKLLPPEVRLVVSFADSSRAHVGYVYQATNFIYCGTTAAARLLEDKEGFEFHPRLLGMYRKRHPEYKSLGKEALCDLLGFIEKPGGIKHRYIFIRNKKDRKIFLKVHAKKIENYPKGVSE